MDEFIHATKPRCRSIDHAWRHASSLLASGDSKDGVAGPQREAAAAVADRGGRGAQRQVGHSQGQGDQARSAPRGYGAANGTGLSCLHLAIPFSLSSSPCMFCLRMDMLSFPKSQKGQQHYTGITADVQIATRCVLVASAQPREATSCPWSPPSARAFYVGPTHFSPHLLPSPPLTSTRALSRLVLLNPFLLQVRCAELGT
jgi:hypothetical protein